MENKRVGERGISGDRIGEIVVLSAERAGLGDVGYTGHSLRRGLITAAHEAGHDRRYIAAISGHVPGSRTLEAYVEARDKVRNSALNGLGL
ncbi:hypothetical protein ACWDYH_24830 [Nocardia goodfellowii]